jgi:hypothetical protein
MNSDTQEPQSPCMTIVMHQFNEPEYFKHEFMNDPLLISPALAALQQPTISSEDKTVKVKKNSSNEYQLLEEASTESDNSGKRVDWNHVQYYLLSGFLVALPLICLAYCFFFNRTLIRDNYFLRLCVQFFFIIGFYVVFATTASFFGYAPLFSHLFIKSSSTHENDEYGQCDDEETNARYSKEGYYFGQPDYSHIVENPTPLFVYTVSVDEKVLEETRTMYHYQD